MFEDHNRYVTPFLPIEARERIKEWQLRKKVAFVRPVPEQAPVEGPDGMIAKVLCRNCQDIGYVYVSLAEAGPFRSAEMTGVGKCLVWFEGGDGIGKGWYIVRTEAFACPNCAGRPMSVQVEEEAEKAEGLGTMDVVPGFEW